VKCNVPLKHASDSVTPGATYACGAAANAAARHAGLRRRGRARLARSEKTSSRFTTLLLPAAIY